MMGMTLRFEIFPDDLDVIVDFYTRVLHFRLTTDQRGEPGAYVALQRDDVRIGAARRAGPRLDRRLNCNVVPVGQRTRMSACGGGYRPDAGEARLVRKRSHLADHAGLAIIATSMIRC